MKQQLAVIGLVFLAGFALLTFALSRGIEKYPVTMRIGGTAFKAKLANSDSERQKGLSGTRSLPKNHGMLFVFDDNGFWGIWMKDMNYPLDIIWLSQDKNIVHIEENVEPSTYPRTFTPFVPARYVVEFPANTVSQNHLKEGDKASFNLP